MVVFINNAIIPHREDAVRLGVGVRWCRVAVVPDDYRGCSNVVADIVPTCVATARISGIDAVVLENDAGGGVFNAKSGIGDILYVQILNGYIVLAIKHDTIRPRDLSVNDDLAIVAGINASGNRDLTCGTSAGAYVQGFIIRLAGRSA